MELHGQVGGYSGMTTGHLDGSTLAENARDVGLIPALDTLFPIFISPMALVTVTMIL